MEQLNKFIDHTLLKSTASTEEFKQLCLEARNYQFYSVCVPPVWIDFCKNELRESEVKVITVVGFPLGYDLPNAKAASAKACVEIGAEEIDMVINISWVKAKNERSISSDIRDVVTASNGRSVKVIIEISELTDDEIAFACQVAKNSGASFVKTSTGFSKHGATIKAVELMRATVGANFGVKASGGISDFATAQAMIKAGANRLGCSKSVDIVLGKSTSSGGSY